MTPEKFENLGFRGGAGSAQHMLPFGFHKSICDKEMLYGAGVGADEPKAAQGASPEAAKERKDKKEGFLGAPLRCGYVAALVGRLRWVISEAGCFDGRMWAQLAHGTRRGEARAAPLFRSAGYARRRRLGRGEQGCRCLLLGKIVRCGGWGVYRRGAILFYAVVRSRTMPKTRAVWVHTHTHTHTHTTRVGFTNKMQPALFSMLQPQVFVTHLPCSQNSHPHRLHVFFGSI
jgi:hypothetical protein